MIIIPCLLRNYNGRSNPFIALLDHIVPRLGWDKVQIDTPRIHCCEPGWSWLVPGFDDFDIWLVFAGTGSLELNGKRYALERGQGFVFQPGDCLAASHDSSDPLTVFAWHWRHPARGRTARLAPEALHFLIPNVDFTHGLCLHLTRLSVQPGWMKSAGAGLLHGLLAELFGSVALARSAGQVDRLDGLCMEIRSSPGRDWSLPQMAAACHLSPPQFCRRFRRRFGVSPMQFVIRERVRRARELLKESALSIQEIAAELGYTDVYFFHRQFKRLSGQTPLRARCG